MEKKGYQNLSDEDLLKKRKTIKSAVIGLGIADLLATIIIVYLFASADPESRKITTLLPLFILPITFMPLIVSLSQINTEVKSRNL